MKNINGNLFYNQDCITGSQNHIKSDSIDLIITDPPFAIKGHNLHKHYNRDESFVLDGYIEIPEEEYYDFSKDWIKEAERILKPGGALYIVSGYSNLIDILNALRKTKLKEKNHVIWKYNFGVYTKTKYISSHYHILYYIKPGAKYTFNTFSRFGPDEKDNNKSLNYSDREDVWIITREYKPGKKKNKNELPKKLLTKIIQYSSNEGDLVCDFFLGSFSTAKIAIGLNRKVIGFEKSRIAFNHQIKDVKKVKPGELLEHIRKPLSTDIGNQGKPWTDEDVNHLVRRYQKLSQTKKYKKDILETLCKEFRRGYWSITKQLNKLNIDPGDSQTSLFK